MPRSDPDLLRRLLRAKDRMTAVPAQAWPIRRLARVSRVSEAHFARTFKAAFGVPPHRYLLTLRLERAMALLRDTDRPITEIALSSGWRSLGTFSRTFRDVVGESPSAFRHDRQSSQGPQGSQGSRDGQLATVPGCIARAACRPALRIPVSEKRRIDKGE